MSEPTREPYRWRNNSPILVRIIALLHHTPHDLPDGYTLVLGTEAARRLRRELDVLREDNDGFPHVYMHRTFAGIPIESRTDVHVEDVKVEWRRFG